MNLDEKPHQSELREAAAPLAILRLLGALRPQSRKPVLKCVEYLLQADAGIIDRLGANNRHPAVKSEDA